MIALATPFGTYVSNAVKSTATGLNDTSDKAMSVVGLNGKGEWDDSGNNGGSDTTEIKREAGSVIPTGAKYKIKASNTVLEGNGTNVFPDVPETGDVYEEGDYIYEYGTMTEHGWWVRINDETKTEYGIILSEIAGKSLMSMRGTFESCDSLIAAPAIPSGVTDMNNTFVYCASLTTAPTIPDGVTNMNGTFYECYQLKIAPIMPSSVTNMRNTFYKCSLKTYEGSADPNGDFSNYKIPDNVTNMQGTFYDCTSITKAPTIPNNVTDMAETFYNCLSLTVAPDIPNNVTNMWGTFYYCSSLTTVSTIPSSVTDMEWTFLGCESLTGTIIINANPTNYDKCFAYTVKSIVLKGSSSKLSVLATTATNGNITVK